ncbi:NmrA family transcriptional regulator [Penicillium canescens]|uniref:NmrA family transcriptional regulator n=1 Tax=Penicillium canescens TaxID=5083 RepID=A0AAD6I6F3_PENCN|nr:NmrA family transcriptional regulator [Penicillium canescens]KAJ6002300.1 NmrA family transcriptional regulator [Penicillium canescens]KAJ6034617.1 NmrA family transcriptional regulator [Penicillium canescens]KAJ6046278.1 NmrA family transcriptional regulator [Penicillium canescens]KAJ6053358.1 NmrA family transcriptional regulator [Penicillium canescens]
MAKIIVVFGATGNQGGSVIDSILSDSDLSQEFRVRGVTRNPESARATDLKSKGVEMVAADLSDPVSLNRALEKAHTVFLVTNFWEYLDREVETIQGRNVADACSSTGVQHLICSTVINVSEASQGRLTHVKHFDSKADIEQYVREKQLPATFVHAGFYMSNALTQSIIRKQPDDTYVVAIPVSDEALLPMFDAAADTGKFVKAAIKNRPAVLGQQICACTDYYRPSRLAQEFAEVMGKHTELVLLSEEEYKASVIPPSFGQEAYETYLLMEDPGYYVGKGLEESLELLDEQPTSWKDFVRKNKDKWV